jgi:hypothetical protein
VGTRRTVAAAIPIACEAFAQSLLCHKEAPKAQIGSADF